MLHIRQWKDCAFGSAGLVTSSPWVQRKRDFPGLKICNPEKGICNISLAELKEAIIKQCQLWPWVSPIFIAQDSPWWDMAQLGGSWRHRTAGCPASRDRRAECYLLPGKPALFSSKFCVTDLGKAILIYWPEKRQLLAFWCKLWRWPGSWAVGWRVLVFQGSGGQCAHRRHETSNDSLTCAPGLPLPSALGISNPTKLATSVLIKCSHLIPWVLVEEMFWETRLLTRTY